MVSSFSISKQTMKQGNRLSSKHILLYRLRQTEEKRRTNQKGKECEKVIFIFGITFH